MSSRNFTETVFICSPYKPASTEPLEKAEELRSNIRQARRACELAIGCGYMPLAPHCYFTGFLNDNDPEQRKDGLKLVKGWLDISDKVWVFGDRISEGMAEATRGIQLKATRRSQKVGKRNEQKEK